MMPSTMNHNLGFVLASKPDDSSSGSCRQSPNWLSTAAKTVKFLKYSSAMLSWRVCAFRSRN